MSQEIKNKKNPLQERLQSKQQKKQSSSVTKFVLISIVVLVGALAIYTFTQSNNKQQPQNDKNKRNDMVVNKTKIEEKNITSSQQEEEEEEYEEYAIPSLNETKQINDQLFDETVRIFKQTYNIQQEKQLDDIINSVGELLNHIEIESLPQYFRNQVNNPQKNKDLKKPFMGIYRDNFYCIKSDLYHLAHEKEMYNNITLFSDWVDQYTREDIFGNFSYVASPMYGWELPRSYIENESFAIELNVTQYYLNRPSFMVSFAIGQQFGCLFQGLNKIPSSGSFTRKEGLARTYSKFLKSIEEQNNANSTKKYSEKCMKEFNFLPETYNLNNADECKEFFQIVSTQEYQKKVKEQGFQYISKLGANVHQGKGIHVVTEQIMDVLQKKYQNGQKCGIIKEENSELVQGYLNDPLLLNGVKFEVRMHFVVASINPLIIYAQDKAGVAFCALKYSAHDSQIQRHLCVYNIARRLLELSDEELFKISGKTREQFMGSFSYQHTLETLQEALEKEGSIPSGWVFNSFVPAVFRNFIHTLLMSRSSLQSDQRFYEMYAPDILINKKNMQPYILEYNTNPRMVNTSHFVHDWNLSTIKDIVLINMSQIRSRYFRIKKIVDEYIREIIEKKKPNQELYIEKLLKANINKVEPQFNIDDQLTSYVKIYDETETKDLYYKGNLIFNKECSH